MKFHKSLKELEKKLAGVIRNKANIEIELDALQKNIADHQKELEIITSSDTAANPYWMKTINSGQLNHKTRFIYGSSNIPEQDNSFIFGRVEQESINGVKVIDEGLSQKPPTVSKIRLIRQPIWDNISFADSTALTVSRAGQKISYWSSGYDTAIFEADMETIEERRRYFDYSSVLGEGGSGPGGDYVLWEPAGRAAALVAYISSGFVGMATEVTTLLVDGATSIASYVSPGSSSTYGKFTKITVGHQEIALDTLQWSLERSQKVSSAVINFNNPSERSMCCSIEADAPFAGWHEESYTVEVYVSNRDMPHALERSQELRQEIRMLEEESINLQDAFQRMIQEKQKIETAISLYKSPASVNSTLFYAQDRTSSTANEPVVTLGL